MKVYAYLFDGHGEKDFFVLANNHDEAKEKIRQYVNKKRPEYGYNEWPKGYQLVSFTEGDVFEASND